MTQKFTDLFLKGLKPKNKEYTAREKGGFGVRVLPTGRKVFFYLYRVDGQRRFLNLGDYPGVKLEEARKAFEAAAAQVKLLKNGLPGGVDPVEVKTDKSAERKERREALTVADLITEYLEKHVKLHKRGWQDDKKPYRHEDERILNKDVLPEWGKRKAQDIKKRDVVLLLEKIVERGSPGSANGNFKVIRKMFSFAVERDIIPFSPCTGVKMPAPLNSRERTLTESEIKTLWDCLGAAYISDQIRNALKMIFLTAQRPGEVIGIHTSEIDGDWWIIPAARSKNKKAHRVFLTATVKQIIVESIARIRELRESPSDTKYEGYIFPCPHEKKVQAIAVNALAHAVRRNLEWPILHNGNPIYDKTGKPVTENRLGVDPFTPHDLRRTAATFLSQIGFMDEVIDSVLNHTKQGIIKTYNQNKYDTEKQAAAEALERKINGIITGKENNVIPITAGKKAA